MNKSIILMGVLSLGLAQAQQNDPFEGKVGVNTDTPSATLNVKSKTGTTASTKNFELQNASDKKLVTVLDDGKVGIGTETPEQYLHIKGNVLADGGLFSRRVDTNDGSGPYLELNNPAKTADGTKLRWRIYNMTKNYENGLHFWGYNNVGAGNSMMLLTDEGRLGVGNYYKGSGTNAAKLPTEKLDVDGNARLRTLPNVVGDNSDKVVVVDTDGVLKSVDRASLQGTELWAQRANGNITETYLKPALEAQDFIGYRSDRKISINLGNAQESDFLYSDVNSSKGFAAAEVPNSVAITSDVFPAKSSVGSGKNKFYFNHYNGLLKQDHVANNPSGQYHMREDRFVVKDVTSPISHLFGNQVSLALNSNTNAKYLFGSRSISSVGSRYYKQATAEDNVAGQFEAYNDGTTNTLYGIRAYSKNYGTAHNIKGIYSIVDSQVPENGVVPNHTVKQLFGMESRVNLAKNGTLTERAEALSNILTIEGDASNAKVYGSYTSLALKENASLGYTSNYQSTFAPYANSNTEYYADYATYPVIKAGANVKKYVGYHHSMGNIEEGANIGEMYGIKLDDVSQGTENNYAIHTQAGQVRFGDLKGTGNRNVYADADGVLKVGEAGAMQLAGTEGIVCNDANRGSMNFKRDVALPDGTKTDAFGVCMKNSNGEYLWRYFYGGAGSATGSGAFGNGLQ